MQVNPQKLLKLVFVIVIIGILASLVDPNELWRLLSNVSLPLFAIVVLIALADLVFMGLKWNILLSTFDVPLSNMATILAYLRSRIFAFIAPSTLGVDTYKVFYLKKYYGCPIAPVTSSIVVERVLGLLSSLGISALLLGFVLKEFEFEHKQMLTVLSLFCFVALLLAIHLLVRYSSRLAHITFPAFVPVKLSNMAILLFDNFEKIKGRESRLWLYFALSMLEKTAYGSAIYFSARAIGITDISFSFIIAATPLLAMLERLPISFSTIGVREGLYVLLFAPFYSDTTIPISIALTLRSAEIVQILLFSFVWLVQREPRGYHSELEAIADQMPNTYTRL
jgi:uncharacterized protein (TIRG00374 family)